MVEQGRQVQCTLTLDDSGWVSDRLASFEQVISAESVRQACFETGRVGQRACQLTYEPELFTNT